MQFVSLVLIVQIDWTQQNIYTLEYMSHVSKRNCVLSVFKKKNFVLFLNILKLVLY
jgi:hypothetical protein